ncbi:HNH endonuclease [Klebsiella variicola]|uniref:HNH endonuclease n=1 Tax=Klebsiella variicola TaxID=244366 RepID=UPI000B93CA25|nr:HNH endonuclease signature motif containing protein [Klebsiella variicola]
MTENRPAIPESIKREVRKQCGFGCAICGMPFFQYDHVEEYSEVKEHTSENIVLLCPNHHSAKTTKKLSKERIIEAKSSPFNTNKLHTTSFKIEPSKEILTILGSNILTGWRPEEMNDYNLIWVNGVSYFTIHCEDGWLTTSIIVTDSSGNMLLSVQRGELIVSTDAWDYIYEGENIKIRAGLGEILLDLNLSDKKVEVIQGTFCDSNKDGFIVTDGSLRNICLGNVRGTSRGNQLYGMGGWALLNLKSVPDVPEPNGPFGIFLKYR